MASAAALLRLAHLYMCAAIAVGEPPGASPPASRPSTLRPVIVALGNATIRTVSPSFVSWTIDSASMCYAGWPFPADVDAVTLERIRQHLAPFVLRYGGTTQDYEQLVDDESGAPVLPILKTTWGVRAGCNLTLAKWDQLLKFAAQAGAKLVYGFNALLRVGGVASNAYDPRNARALLNATFGSSPCRIVRAGARRPAAAALLGVSLGNEPSGWQIQKYINLTASAHAADFKALARVVGAACRGVADNCTCTPGHPAAAPAPRHLRNCRCDALGVATLPPPAKPLHFPKTPQTAATLLLGPDLFQFNDWHDTAGKPYLDSFLRSNPAVDVVTAHLYPITLHDHTGQSITPAARDFYNETMLDRSATTARLLRNATDHTLGALTQHCQWACEPAGSCSSLCGCVLLLLTNRAACSVSCPCKSHPHAQTHLSDASTAARCVQPTHALWSFNLRTAGKRVPVWITEGSPSWITSGPLAANLTFELAWADMLGSFAQGGVELFARQSLLAAMGDYT